MRHLDAVDSGHDCMDQHKLQSQRVQGDRVQVWPHNKSHNAQPVPERAHSTRCSKNRPISRMFAESSVRADPTATAERWPSMACACLTGAFFVFRPGFAPAVICRIDNVHRFAMRRNDQLTSLRRWAELHCVKLNVFP